MFCRPPQSCTMSQYFSQPFTKPRGKRFTLLSTHKQHGEEDDCPEEGDWKTEDELGVGEEDEPGPGAGHLLHRRALQVRHVAQDGEDQHARRQAGERVHHARDESVPENGVIGNVREGTG